MTEKIIMPKQGLQMTRGTITNWLKEEGDPVIQGEPLFEIETDKLTITIDASHSGTLLKILHHAGDEVPIAETIAYLGEPGESLPLKDLPENNTVKTADADGRNKGTCQGYDFDTAILGAGPGGYEAAIRCSSLGQKTLLIEADELGGTCLNRGCIPTKALLACASAYHMAHQMSAFGIYTGSISYDYSVSAAYKDAIVNRLRGGIAALEKAHSVTVEKGFGVLLDNHTIKIDNTKKFTAQNIILATGSSPSKPPIPGINGENILTSNQLLSLKSLPDSLLIIGGGVIGVEFATLFSQFGKKVTILEMMPALLPGMDTQITELLTASLKDQGVTVYTEAKLISIQGGLPVSASCQWQNRKIILEADCCLISTGRKPDVTNLGLETLGICMSRGFVEVDNHLRTSIPNIYAIGDITGKSQLAHTASAQGLCAASCCAGADQVMRYDIIPTCVYSEPEIASVGINSEQAKKLGTSFRIGAFHIAGNGKAMIMHESRGLAKILSNPQTGEILGAQIMAPRASDMIGEIAAVMRCEGTIEELGDTIHPHPTISEIILEAAHDTEGLSCNKMPVKTTRED